MELPSGQGPAHGRARTPGRLRILELLQKSSVELGIQELSEQVGLHPNTVRFHLGRLVGDGVVHRHLEGRTTPGRPRVTFTAADTRSDERSYPLLAKILASLMTDALPDAAQAATNAGRAWGHYLTERTAPYSRTTAPKAIGTLVGTLDTMGFAPEVFPEIKPTEIHLRNCPFREVAELNSDVVCGVHLGIMQGVLAELGAPVTADRLEPFVEPSLCIAHLGDARSLAHKPADA